MAPSATTADEIEAELRAQLSAHLYTCIPALAKVLAGQCDGSLTPADAEARLAADVFAPLRRQLAGQRLTAAGLRLQISTDGDVITVGNIAGVGIAIGTGASVTIYGDIHYYPITLHEPLRSGFKPLVEDRIRLFGGRGAALAQIGAFIQEAAGGYLLVTAPAAFGKTALMAALVSRTPEAFAYHFFTSLYGADGLREDFFLRNVVQQLAEWHGQKERLPDDLNELRALYQRFLDTPLERTRILVLDGLDEVTTWQLAPYLSRRLPAGLHIILTVRDVGQDWLGEYQLPVDQVTHLPLGGLNRDEIAAVLRAASERGITLANDAKALDRLLKVAAYEADPSLGADPFYVRLLAEDVQAGVLTPGNLTDQPHGLDRYLDRWWQEIKQRAGDRPTRDLFGTLTTALGPIGRADLEAVNPSLVNDWSCDYFDDVLREVRRFVVGDDQRGYALIHPRLRQYLRTRIKVEPYRDRLLGYCAKWAHHQSRYALAYYIQHLAEEGQIDMLVATVKNLRYLAVKTFALKALATESDLQTAEQHAPDDTALHLLLRSFIQCEHLLNACADLETLKATLYSRLCHLEQLAPLTGPFEATLARPYLAPRHPLPDLPDPTLLRTLAGHDQPVVGCATSADGDVIVSASWDKTLNVWDGKTGACLHVLRGHRNAVSSCAISHDGQVIVSASYDNTIKVWDAKSGVCRHTLKGHSKTVASCAVSADGSVIVSASLDGTLKVWDANNGNLIQTLSPPLKAQKLGQKANSTGSRLRSCALNGDGTIAITASTDHLLQVWNIAQGELLHQLQGHTKEVWDCAISADGRVVASASRDRTVRLWDGKTGILTHILEGHTDWVRSCALNKDGTRVVSASDDGTVRLWDTNTGTLVGTLGAHTKRVRSCAITADATLIVSGSDDRMVQIWDGHSSVGATAQSNRSEHMRNCAVSGDGATIVSALDNGQIRVWGGMGTVLRYTLLGHAKTARGCAVSGDGQIIVSASHDRSLKVWDGGSGSYQSTLSGHRAEVWSCAVSADGSVIVSASTDRTLKVWEMRSGVTLHTLHGHIDEVRDCALSADGSVIVSASNDRTLRVWDYHTGRLLCKLEGHTDRVGGCAISSDSRMIVSASRDHTLRIWAVDHPTGWEKHDGRSLLVLKGHTDAVFGCAISRDCTRVVSASLDQTIRVWNGHCGTCLATLHVDSQLYKCGLWPDGKHMVVAGAGGLYLLWLLEP